MRAGMFWCVWLCLFTCGLGFADQKPAMETAKTPRIAAVRTKEAPQIDGKIEALWDKAAVLPLVANSGVGAGSAVSLSSQARVLYDDQSLYIAFIFEDPNVTFKYVNPDDMLWDSADRLDLAEVLLQPDAGQLVYYEFVIDPFPALLDAQVKWKKGKPTWNILWPDKQPPIAAGRLSKSENGFDGWCAELSIPFASIGFKASRGSVIKANFHRADVDLAAVWLAWSPTFDRSIHIPQRFGELVF